MEKPRVIKFHVLLGTDETLKTEMTFMDDCAFKPGETFLMQEIIPTTKTDEELSEKYASRFKPDNGWGHDISKEAFLAGMEAERNRK